MQDTDADWAIWGEHDPYFGVLFEERYKRENLTPEALEEFFASGVRQIGEMAGQIRHVFGPFQTATALDFGCGVGRLTRAMASMCDHVIGLDVSPGMVAEARKIAPDNVEYLLSLSDQTFDWINSVIVFQHIPPERGYAILEDLLRRVNRSGVISLQFTLYKDARFLPTALGSLQSARWDGRSLEPLRITPAAPGAMMMYDYDLTRLTEILARHGFQTLLSQHTDHGGCHGVTLFGRHGV